MKVEILHSGKIIAVPFCENKTVYNYILSSNENMTHNFYCGGKRTCKKCRVKILENPQNVSCMSEEEKNFLSEKEIRENIRLACMCEVLGEVKILVDLKNTDEHMEIQTTGIISEYKNLSALKMTNIILPPARLDHPVSDENNFHRCMSHTTDKQYILPLRLIQKLTNIKNKNKATDISVISYENKIIDITPTADSLEKDMYGVAVDIGTTTVAVYLCDIQGHKIIDVEAVENPQRAYGADVISRISYIIENEKGLETLNKIILLKIFELVSNLAEKNNIKSDDIYVMVLTGNTVMQHIAANLSPAGIAFAPFTASSLFNLNVGMEELTENTKDIGEKLPLNKYAVAIFPPSFASYVGGDTATGIIASDIDLSEKERLFLDIGTNGEIGFGNSRKLTFCATAAGPAFEGAHIKMGMAGVKGAVNRIYISESEKKILYDVIGNREDSTVSPLGICGSGIIDAVAVMLRTGVIDETGRICDKDETDGLIEGFEYLCNDIDEVDGENVFYIDRNHGIYVTQKDIREVQLAKASVAAGISTVLKHTGKTLSDVDELILAGGFGTHTDKKSACTIGLIPPELENKIVVAGNTAGMGAVSMLFDANIQNRLNKLISISNYIELSGDSYFMEKYVDMMMFQS